MNIPKCPNCGVNIKVLSDNCRKCGFEFDDDLKSNFKKYDKKSKKFVMGCALVILLFIFFTCALTSNVQYKINQNSNGVVTPVKTYLAKNLKDPESVEYLKWTKLFKNDLGHYQVTVQFKAKNQYGVMVQETKTFIMDSTGVVLKVLD